MQGKVMSEQCAMGDITVGIDVCKDWLDIHILPANISMRVSNDKKGHKQLLKALCGQAVKMVVMEATGKYHRSIHNRLHDEGFAVAVVNPLQIGRASCRERVCYPV